MMMTVIQSIYVEQYQAKFVHGDAAFVINRRTPRNTANFSAQIWLGGQGLILKGQKT
jgi:hypothetical protein